VTVVEYPEWGALTGAVTAGADDQLVFDPPDMLDLLPPFFIVLSGPCTTAAVDGHSCVGRWPGGYLPDEHCDIIVAGGGAAVLGPCPVFDTHGNGDALALVGGARYYNANCPAGEALAAGDALSWRSDSNWQAYSGGGLPGSRDGAGGGWQICFA
jgi:hypothetical protein